MTNTNKNENYQVGQKCVVISCPNKPHQKITNVVINKIGNKYIYAGPLGFSEKYFFNKFTLKSDLGYQLWPSIEEFNRVSNYEKIWEYFRLNIYHSANKNKDIPLENILAAAKILNIELD